MGSPKKFKTAVVGGTFDHFHKGHKSFLNYGLSVSQKLIIGITSDEYVKNLKAQISNIKNTYQSSRHLKSFPPEKKRC